MHSPTLYSSYTLAPSPVRCFMQSLRLFAPLRSSFKLHTRVHPNLQRAAFTTTIRAMAQEFKLKGVSSLNMKNGEKQEVEVEGVEGGKVLLCKVQDKVHAMSANCTHYGAPLKMGVLTPDGRLTCPWHGGEYSMLPLMLLELI